MNTLPASYWLTCVCLIIVTPVFTQDYKSEFATSRENGDTLNQRLVLAKWETATPKDAELFTAYFNYYFLKAQREVISLNQSEPQGESLSIRDSSGNTVGFIGSTTIYDKNIIERALAKIDEGIGLYPDRLDMRFGKIYVLGATENWQRFTDEIVSTIQYSGRNNNNWTWTGNHQQPQGKSFFLRSLQDYQLQLYNTGVDSLLLNMRTIASEVLRLYPGHLESLSNLSITYLLNNEYDAAIDILLKAEHLAPHDPVILGNIAEAYKRKGEKKKAVAYFRKTIKWGDEQSIAYSEEQIKELSQ